MMEEDCFVHFIHQQQKKHPHIIITIQRNNQGRSLARLALSARARDTEQGHILKREREREFVSS